MGPSNRVFFLLRFVLNSAKTRQAALESLRNAMTSKMLYEFILERRMTLTDSIERCLRKGNFLMFESQAQNREGECAACFGVSFVSWGGRLAQPCNFPTVGDTLWDTPRL